MAEMKRNFAKAKMNKDSDERIVPNGEYRHAVNVQVATSNAGDVGALQNIKGTTAINSLVGGGTFSHGSDNDSCVGIIADQSTDSIYYLLAGDTSGGAGKVKSDYIVQYDYNKDELTYVFVDIYEAQVDGTKSGETFTLSASHRRKH